MSFLDIQLQNLSTTNFSFDNSSTVNIDLIKKLENNSTNKVLSIGYDCNSITNIPTMIEPNIMFKTPSYLMYRNKITYNSSSTDYPKKPALSSKYANRIFCYLDITITGKYNFESIFAGGIYKFYINNYVINEYTYPISAPYILYSTPASTNLNNSIYLTKGKYLLTIERYIDNRSGNGTATPATVFDKTFTLQINITDPTGTVKSIDDYLSSINYTLFKNTSTSKNIGLQTYCTTKDTLESTTNVCNSSMTSSNILLNNINNYCFNNSINPNFDENNNYVCKVIYDKANLNSDIKTQIYNISNNWINKQLTSKDSIISNEKYLTPYIGWMLPSDNDVPITNSLINYCEDIFQKNEQYSIDPNTNKLCDTIYNRNKNKDGSDFIYNTTNKNLLNTSIQNIKTNYCNTKNTEGDFKYITTDNCKNELQTNNKMNNNIMSYCFPNGELNKDLNSKTINKTCKDKIRNLNNLNTDIAVNYDESYAKWATANINSTKEKIINNQEALNEYIQDTNPSVEKLFGISKDANNSLIDFCESNIDNSKIAFDSNSNNLCNNLYSNSIYNSQPNILKSRNNITNNYCTVKDPDTNKYRYENDPLCINLYSDLLHDTISNRCYPNEIFNSNDNFCTNLSDNNITSNLPIYKELNNARTILMKKDIEKGLDMKNNDYLNKTITNNLESYKYAIGKYKDYPDKKIKDELLTQSLFDFCENKDSNYKLNKDSQCYGIYNTFNTENDIIISNNKMRDSLCVTDEYISTNNNSEDTNAYNCKELVFNSNDIGKYANVINNYCSQNIDNPNCINYYSNIENSILKDLGLIKSTFINHFINNNKKSNFNNCNSDNNDYNQDDINLNYEENNESDLLYYLLLLFLLIVIVIAILLVFNTSSCSNKNINKNINNKFANSQYI